MIKLLCCKAHPFQIMQCESGSVTIFVCIITSSVLILAAALALDITRGEILQGRISSALDASGLAVEKQVQSIPASQQQAWANAQAQRFFNVNFPQGYLGTNPILITVSPVTPDWVTITLNTNASMPTLLMKVVGIQSITASASTTVTAARLGSR